VKNPFTDEKAVTLQWKIEKAWPATATPEKFFFAGMAAVCRQWKSFF